MIVDIISRSALVGFSLLRASYYYNYTGIVCYIYSVYILNSYGDLLINVFYMLSQYISAEVYKLLMYFDLQEICYFFVFYL